MANNILKAIKKELKKYNKQ